MSVLYKQPSETKILYIEFSEYLSPGDSLSSITSITESTGTISIYGEAISGTKVQASYSGGVDGTLYSIVAIVATTDGETLEVDVYLRVLDTSATTVLASYFSLLERVGHQLYGIRSGFTADQTADIENAIVDGLRRVYAAHDWSFFRPIEDLSTTAPYTTGTIEVVDGVVTLTAGTFPSWAADGLLKADNGYYSVASRDGDTQVTLDDTTVDIDAATTYELGRPEIPLDASFEAVSGDSDLTYYPDQNELYPPVRMRHDQAIRTWQQNDPYFDRPVYYSVRTVEFDPTTGSRRRLAFYPVPDAAYVVRCPMILRQTMVDETNLFPVGAEQLSQLITEACLASAEHNFDDSVGVHEKLYQELLPAAIRTDQERSSPTSLGPDMPRSGQGRVSNYWARASRMGSLSLDGDNL